MTRKLKKAQAWPIVRQVFPKYRGRTFRLEHVETVSFWDTNWGGGTRNRYGAVRLDEPKAARLSNVPAPWDNPVEGLTITLPPDVAIVKHTIFCGKDVGCTIYLNPRSQVCLNPHSVLALEPPG